MLTLEQAISAGRESINERCLAEKVPLLTSNSIAVVAACQTFERHYNRAVEKMEVMGVTVSDFNRQVVMGARIMICRAVLANYALGEKSLLAKICCDGAEIDG